MTKNERPEIAPGITVDRDDGFGKPVVKGSGIRVEEILLKLAEGTTIEALALECGLTQDGIRAAFAYAAELADEEPKARGFDGKDEPDEVSPGVVKDPRVRFGKAVLKGRRMDVASLLGYLAAGESIEELAQAYSLSVDQVRDGIRYGHMLVARELVSAS